jgi:hypothetical protein
MAWRSKQDRDSFKEAWLCFENDRGRFPLYPGQHATLVYSYVFDDGRGGSGSSAPYGCRPVAYR